MNDSPQPQVPLEFGFRKINLDDNLSSIQSISDPTMEKSAFESMYTLMPSCSINSSNLPGCVTYSKLYVNPEHPLFSTPILINCGSGWSNKPVKCFTALALNVINDFLGRNVLFCLVFVAGFWPSFILGVAGSTVAVDIMLDFGVFCDSVSVFPVAVSFSVACSGSVMSFNDLLVNLDALDLLAGADVLWFFVDTFSIEFNECLDHFESFDSPVVSPRLVFFMGYVNPE